MFRSFFLLSYAPLPVVTQQLASLLSTFFFFFLIASLFLNGALMCFSVFSLSEGESVFVLFFFWGWGGGGVLCGASCFLFVYIVYSAVVVSET